MSGLDRISELEHQLDLLRAEVEKQRIAYLIILKSDEAEKEEKEKESKSTNKRWRAEKRDTYWFVDGDGTPKWWHEYSRDIDGFYYDTHNYFQTEEKAQKYANILETERQLKKFADEHNDVIDWTDFNQEKWYLYYSYKYYKVSIANHYWTKQSRIIHFSSEEIAKQAIDEIGTEEIKEYLTYEW